MSKYLKLVKPKMLNPKSPTPQAVGFVPEKLFPEKTGIVDSTCKYAIPQIDFNRHMVTNLLMKFQIG